MSTRKAEFEEQGYLVLPGFCTPAECDALITRAAALSKSLEGKDEISIFQTSNQSKSSNDYFLASGNNISYFFEHDAFDDNGIVRQPVGSYLSRIGYALHDLDPVFESFSRSPKLSQLANVDLGLADQLIIQSVYIFKHAKIGGGLNLHQDSTFTYTEPDSCIGFWFALDDATVDNGCLWAKPGGHRTSLRKRFHRTEDGGTAMHVLDETPLEAEGFVPLEAPKGTCIVLHGLLPHYSMHNTSGSSRQAFAIHTISQKANYPTDNWLQREIAPLRGF